MRAGFNDAVWTRACGMVVIGQQQSLLDAGQNWIPKQVPTRGAFVSKLVAHRDSSEAPPLVAETCSCCTDYAFPLHRTDCPSFMILLPQKSIALQVSTYNRNFKSSTKKIPPLFPGTCRIEERFFCCVSIRTLP